MTTFISSKTAKFAAGLVGVVAGFAMIATSVSAATFTTNLKQGSTGADVKNLQILLNSDPATQVAATGAGSPGMETSTFGPATKRAVIKFQNKYASDTLAPAGLTAGTGFVGALTRAKLNTMGGSTTTTTASGCTSNVGFSPTTGASCAGSTTTTTTIATTTASGPLSVSLANSNPAASAVVTGQAGAGLLDVTFSGTGTITNVKLMRTGISANTTLNNVYLYNGSVRVSDGVSVDSNSAIVFNNLNIAVNGSLTLSVRADIATGTPGQIVGVQLVGYTTSGSTSMTTASISGNYMSVASATLATAAFGTGTTVGASDPGTALKVWESIVSVGTRDITLTRLALRQIGSINSSDINNFKLFADGVEIAKSASLGADGYVTFSGFSKTLTSGSRTLKVEADVIGGSGRTVDMSLRGAYDASFADSQFAVGLLSTATFPVGSASWTVNPGTMTVVKASDSQSSTVTLGASDQPLAKYTITAYGEKIKVETLKVGMINASTTAALTIRNVRLMVNGSQVGSTTDVPQASTFGANSGTQFTTNFYVSPGTPATVEIRGDMVDSNTTNGDDIALGAITSIQAVLIGGAGRSNAIPQVSLGTINVPSVNNIVGNTLTIGSGSISLAKTSTYPNQTTAVPATAYKIGSFQLSGNSTEAVNLNTLYVGWAAGDSITPSTDLSDLYVVYGGTTTSVKGTVIGATGAVTNANSWSISKTLAKNETISVDVYATLASTVSTNAIVATLAVAGNTPSGLAVYADTDSNATLAAGLVGQTITGAVGSITISRDADTALAQLVDDSGIVKSLTTKLVALTDSYTVTDVTVTVSNVSAVSTVTLKEVGTGAVVGVAKPGATTLTWNGLNLLVPAGTTKYVYVELALSSVGVNAGTTDSALTTAVTAFTARRSSDSVSATGTGTATGDAIYVYKAIPLLTATALPSTLLGGGEKVIAKFSVSSNGSGTIAWKQAMFEITKSAAPTLGAATLWNTDTGLQVTAASVYQNGTAGVATTCVADNTFCELLLTVGTNADDDVVEQVSTTKNYEVRATIGGTLAVGNSVSTKLDRNTTTHAASAAEQTNDNSLAAGNVSFVWSDESASATGDTGVATWQKDYLVKNTPLNWALNL